MYLGKPFLRLAASTGRFPATVRLLLRPLLGITATSCLVAACGGQGGGAGQPASAAGLGAAGKHVGVTGPGPASKAPHSAEAPSAGGPSATSHGNTELPAGLVTEASLWKVRTKQDSYWHNLAPWAFWSIEAARPRVVVELGSHHGYSYFAFAQAIQTLGLATKSFAVDTWQGDAHLGHYDDSVYREFEECNQKHYKSFSTSLRMTFDEALGHIEDGSVDLLHIDGQHFYEDVSHDFETWRPKLSDRAIVLFHDIDVTGHGFGVYRFWAEITQKYPSFAFHQEAGLGILGVGPNIPERFATLFALRDEQQLAHLSAVYRELGEAANAWDAPANCSPAGN